MTAKLPPPTITPQVYLDSSDFSILSDPRRLTPSLMEVLRRLKRYAEESLVEFRFSRIHVCEIAPISTDSQEAARRRAQLIWDLCGNHALVDYITLMRSEVLQDGQSPKSEDGRWYPALDDLLPVNVFQAQREELVAMLRHDGMNRAQRRQIERAALNKRGLKGQAAKIADASLGQSSAEMLKVFPFSNEELDSVMQYLRTGRKKAESEAALHRVLADPRWLIERFASSSGGFEQVSAWLREQGQNIANTFTEIAAKISEAKKEQSHRSAATELTLQHVHDDSVKAELMRGAAALQQKLEGMESAFWIRLQTNGVNTLIERISQENGIPVTGAVSLAKARAQYPGISAVVAATVHAAQRASSDTPRNPMASDFGDALHAFYAPYVDIFRPDAFMADAVAKAVAGSGTLVVRRLLDLPDAIEKALNS